MDIEGMTTKCECIEFSKMIMDKANEAGRGHIEGKRELDPLDGEF